MAIKFDTFKTAGGGAGTDTLDDVTTRGATTTNSVTVGGVTIGTEYSLPSTDGSVNQVISTDGSGNLSFATISGGGGYTFSAITANTTAQIEYHYSCDTSGGAFTLTLPALSGVTVGQEIRVKLATAGNDLTIAVTGSDTIDDLSSYTLSVAKSSITLVANTAGTDWEIV